MKTILLLSALFAFPTFYVNQDTEADRLLGVWEPSNGKARVKIEKIGNKYYGKIVWLKEPNDPATNQPKVDAKNPDASVRNVPLKGYRMLKDFTYSGSSQWENGTIYDPENGSTYKCVIKMTDANTLDIRGYIGIEALGRTDVWKRLEVKK
ncbi:MAG: hypothetical protein RLZZ262_781 [Bacteroidota bacterium]|jgi:uncharacterized protein (DUF2147 family)